MGADRHEVRGGLRVIPLRMAARPVVRMVSVVIGRHDP